MTGGALEDATTEARPADRDGSPDASVPALAANWIERLDLPDGGVAYVAPPVGAVQRRPGIVAVHGAVDDPGLMCSAWRLIADAFPFVVCPGGSAIGPPGEDRKYVWPSSDAIERAIDRALDATAARFPAHFAREAPLVYVAFSQGANMAGPVLAHRGKQLRRAVLTEGGYRTFETSRLANAFAKAGGDRVLFTCSQPGCAGGFAAAKSLLAPAGVDVRVAYSGAHGHSMPPEVRAAIHGSFAWLVEGLPGWEAYASAPRLERH